MSVSVRLVSVRVIADPIDIPMPRLLTVRDVQRLAQIGRRQSYELMRRVGTVQLGHSLRVRQIDLEAYFDRQRLPGADAAA